ncbi:uncharacterized protein LOC105194836 [Solenopsis invicta]|uniref:uncharacterized protein LOC105194836 n=1 Tax=Solenopsis invicta TaxID=13686 RepID=UPI00193E7D69|nr:uncharacterized protein LOC105194836 [Solenopsis invicta]
MRIILRISTLLIIYACIDGDLLCNGAANCTDRSDEDSKLYSRIGWPLSLQTVRPPTETIRPSPVQTPRRIRSPVTPAPNTCKVPSQPQNGQWKLHPDQCSSEQECNVAQKTELGLGSLLVYSCFSGFKIRGLPYVSCIIGGKWINIPDCIPDIRCKPLSTASVDATCTYDGEWVSCESPVQPRTTAVLQCRNSYRPETNPLSEQRNNVRCNENGQWEPEPMRCIPVCGTIPPDIVPLIMGGNRPNITEFPWHASLYRNVNEQKQFFCGATIIQENLLITAAHCVYDESTRKLIQAKSIYVLTGNIFRDYDHPAHDQRIVKKNQVKRIYIIRNYLGLIGNYIWDIAILELTRPFVLSTWLVPVCIDTLNSNNRNVLEVDSYGKVAGFGRTTHGGSSAVLQALTVPMIPLSQCRFTSQQFETEQLITVDKFCAGYTNGSSVCDGDSGGGLVFKTNSLWYLGGIVSVSLGTFRESDGSIRCGNSYSLFTKVSSHISWIEDVVSKIERNQIQMLCSSESQTKCSYFDNKYSLLYELGFFYQYLVGIWTVEKAETIYFMPGKGKRFGGEDIREFSINMNMNYFSVQTKDAYGGECDDVDYASLTPAEPEEQCGWTAVNARTTIYKEARIAVSKTLRTVCFNMRIVRQISTLLIIYGVCIDGLLCIGATNCTDRSDENSKLCSRIGWPSFLKLIRPPMETIRPPPVQISRRIRSPVTSASNTCKVPPQPQNGQWKLHPDQCSGEQECNVAQKTELGLGSLLVYSCYSGFKIRGSVHVTCIIGGKWINIPDCEPDVRCKPLSTESVDATCTYDDEWVSCGSSVRPETKATLKCRNGYRPETNSLSRQRNNVRCNVNGQWEPEPMRCISVCGTIPPDIVPLIVGGNRPNITEFPWHASLYRNVDEQKQYFCGATIIQENLLITAATCVYNEETRKPVQAKSIYVLTGNIFRDYDSPLHDPRLVHKNQVKRIYIRRSYLGLVGNYLWDIAILELVRPFVLSTWLVPICIDILNDRDNVLEVGSLGKLAGFGRTAHGESSALLQALTVPVISLSQCRSASQNANTEQFITIDKFCAGYTNGSGVCDGDSGGGLVFKTNSLWYLRGIVSVSLGTIQEGGNAYCDYNLYSLYTKVSSHISWIQDVITKIEENQIQILCSSESETKCSYFDNKYSLLYELGFF